MSSSADLSAHGTRKLETETLGRLEVLVPPLAEQLQIVAVPARRDFQPRCSGLRHRTYHRPAQGAPRRPDRGRSYRADGRRGGGMNVTRLKLANLRAIEAAEFRFQPGFNLLSALTASERPACSTRSVCASRQSQDRSTSFARRVDSFTLDDIRSRRRGPDRRMRCPLRRAELHLPDSQAAGDERSAREEDGNAARAGSRHAGEGGVSRRRAGTRVRQRAWWAAAGRAVLDESSRARLNARPRKSVASGGIAAAFADAFANRELRLGEFAAWIRVQEALRKSARFGARTDGPR